MTIHERRWGEKCVTKVFTSLIAGILRVLTICHCKSIELIVYPHSITTNRTLTLVFQERRQDLLGQMAPQDLQDLQDPRDPQGFQGFLEFQEQLLWAHLALQVLLVLKDLLASKGLLVSSCFSALPQAPLPVL